MKILCGALALAACLIVMVFTIVPAAATPEYLARFAADPLSSPQFRNSCDTCHVSAAGGGARNEFGEAFAAAGYRITADMRAQFSERFEYPIQTIDDATEIHYADPDGRTVFIKTGDVLTLVDPAHPPGDKAAAGTNKSAAGAGNDARPQGIDWVALLPEGEGREVTSVACMSCHNLKYIVGERRADQAGWETTIERMIYAQIAYITEEEVPIIARYLAEHFGPDVPTVEIPLKVNSAAREELLMLPGISEEGADRLLDLRQRARIDDLSEVAAAVGEEAADRIRTLISFD